MFQNPRRGRQARNFNKCSENSRSQIVFRTDIFRKLSLGAPDYYMTLRSECRGRILREEKVKSTIGQSTITFENSQEQRIGTSYPMNCGLTA